MYYRLSSLMGISWQVTHQRHRLQVGIPGWVTIQTLCCGVVLLPLQDWKHDFPNIPTESDPNGSYHRITTTPSFLRENMSEIHWECSLRHVTQRCAKQMKGGTNLVVIHRCSLLLALFDSLHLISYGIFMYIYRRSAHLRSVVYIYIHTYHIHILFIYIIHISHTYIYIHITYIYIYIYIYMHV